MASSLLNEEATKAFILYECKKTKYWQFNRVAPSALALLDAECKQRIRERIKDLGSRVHTVYFD